MAVTRPLAAAALVAVLGGLAAALSVSSAAPGDVLTIEPRPAAMAFTGYATFWSGNQKLVDTPHGLVMAYAEKARLGNAPDQIPDVESWALAQSRDGGRTFATVFEAEGPSRPPMVEVDGAGVVLVVHPLSPDEGAWRTRIYRFVAGADHVYRLAGPPVVVPGSSLDKYTSYGDSAGRRLYFATYAEWQDHFFELDAAGDVTFASRVYRSGPVAQVHYPHLAVNEADGTLFLVWVALQTFPDGRYRYRSIHALRSVDRGRRWLAGGRAVVTPVAGDETGPSLRVSVDEDAGYQNTLASVLFKNDALHVAYTPGRPDDPWVVVRNRYVRVDPRSGAVQRQQDLMAEARVVNGVRGRLGNFHEYFVGRAGDGRLFLVSALVEDGTGTKHLAVFRSDDNGSTWLPHALGPGYAPPTHIYALSGPRTSSRDGDLLGHYTLLTPECARHSLHGKPNGEGGFDPVCPVMVFRVPATPRAARGG